MSACSSYIQFTYLLTYLDVDLDFSQKLGAKIEA